MEWDNRKLQQGKILSELGGNCRVRTLQPVKVLETNFSTATGENPNVLNTVYGKVPYRSPESSQVREQKEYIIDFETQKGKTYIIVPL